MTRNQQSWAYRAILVTAVLTLYSMAAVAWGATLNVGSGQTYSTIQSAIVAASNGDVVVVHPGTYAEETNFLGKAITVRSTDPGNPLVVSSTIIHTINSPKIAVAFTSGEGSSSILDGMHLVGKPGGGRYGVNVSSSSSPTIRRCRIDGSQVGVNSVSSSPTVENCVFDSCVTGVLCSGGTASLTNVTLYSTLNGLSAQGSSTVSVSNSIVVGGTGNAVLAGTGSAVNLSYCDVWGGTLGTYSGMADQTGTNGNISAAPRFVNPGGHDFHLKSEFGHYDDSTASWIIDSVSSPCLDAGNPASNFASEPMPNGGRINQGAYGGSPFASKSALLQWAGLSSYEADGVAPDVAAPGSTFTFKVKYRHAGGAAPVAVKVQIIGPGNAPIAGSPFKMATEGTVDYAAGTVFTKDVVLPSRGWYAYYFIVNDGVTGYRWLANALTPGPLVDNAPVLSWTGEAGYTDDGLDPYRAVAGSTFVFRVKYSDADGDPPVALNLRLFNAMDGTELPGSPVPMTRVGSGTDWVGGEIYTASVVYPNAGIYEYYFKANDGIASTRLPAAGSRQLGPRVDAPPAPTGALSGVTAQQVADGVSISYVLAAAADVSATVYNMAGRPVAQLPLQAQEAGVQSVRWNGRNSTGSLVPAGVYLISVKAAAPDGSEVSGLCALQLRR